MPVDVRTLASLISQTDKTKIPIGYTDLKGYERALGAMKSIYEESDDPQKQTPQGLPTKVSDLINRTAEVDLEDSTIDRDTNFVKSDTLKQMWMPICFIGGVPLQKNDNETYIGQPNSNNRDIEKSGGNFGKNNNERICTCVSQNIAGGGEYKVGVLLDLRGRGEEYIKHFYPTAQSFEGSRRDGVTSLTQLAQDGSLFAEIAIPTSNENSVTKANVIIAQVIGDINSQSTSNTIYFTTPLAFHKNFSKIFKASTNDSFPYSTNQYSSLEGQIKGFTADDLIAKNPSSVEQISIEPTAQHCRVRLWAYRQRTKQTNNIPEEFYNRNYESSQMDSASIFEVGQNKTIDISNNLTGQDVFIDPGHTALSGYRQSREWPKGFSKTNWSEGKPAKIASIIGFNKNTEDAVEHMLNLRLGKLLAGELGKLNISYRLYDAPKMEPDTERGTVVSMVNESKPKCFVSIHSNASDNTKEKKELAKSLSNEAWGTVVFYNHNKTLAETISNAVEQYRIENGGADQNLHGSKKRSKGAEQSTAYGVLTGPAKSIPTALVECCFYDNLEDLYWLTTHLEGFAKTLAYAIKTFLKK